jgi:chromosome segregation protein
VGGTKLVLVPRLPVLSAPCPAPRGGGSTARAGALSSLGHTVFLKSLTLKGFKSFADPTTLELEPGITVVVGPNGSGKSNVVDAVAWVIGAQGPRTVRSSKMEDVIFAGSERRPALGRAEVSLTIDNSSGRLPIALSEVTITRTLWRSGESEYAINGAPCRLLDVQELLSDSGVGRQQHVILGQGQLDSVLGARPEDRRLIIEEAAGVLKYRRRRERTERRLAATEGDLGRLQDLLREVRRQVRPLERQAEAARRYDSLVAEHRALRLYLAGKELSEAGTLVEAAAAAGTDLESKGQELRERLQRLEDQLVEAERLVATNRVDDLNLAIGRLEGLRERGRGLGAVIAERRRSLERSLATTVDAGLVAALEAEGARIREGLAAADRDAEALGPELADLERSEAALAREKEAAEANLQVDGLATAPGRQGALFPERRRPGSSPGELRGRLVALQQALERDRSQQEHLDEALAGLKAKVAALLSEAGSHRAELAAADQAERPIVGDLEGAEHRRREAETEVQAAEAQVAALEEKVRSWATRAEALALALEDVRARGGLRHLQGAPGLLGTLAELVEVDPGWELAFKAAVDDAVASVVMRGVAEAVAALERLAAEGASGTVIAADGGPSDQGRSPPGGQEAAPGGEEVPGRGALVVHVRSSDPGLHRALRRLLAGVVVAEGDWRSALDLFLAGSGRVVVSRDGDRFGPEGWRIGDPGPGATGSALAEARSRTEQAEQALVSARAHCQRRGEELERVRAEEARLQADLDANDERMGRAADDLQRAEAELSRIRVEVRGLEQRREELGQRAEETAREVAELEAQLRAAVAAEVEEQARWRQLEMVLGGLDRRQAELRARRHDLEVRRAGLEERRALLRRRLDEIEERLAASVKARQEAATRREGLEAAMVATARLGGMVTSCEGRLSSELDALEARRRQRLAQVDEQRAALARLRQERVTQERGLAEVHERIQRNEIQLTELRLRREATAEALRRDLDVEPESALSAACPQLPPGTTPVQRARDLERELRLLGPVNPLAVAELESLEERARFLEGQLEDVRGARRELVKVIRAIDAEIASVFSAAYDDVSRHFSDLMATLFPGGSGSLSFTDPTNLLETGVEISARPAGKQVRKLSLLSGGERSLVALAFLCAVYRSRPSPFYIMDEVEAALDDVNLHRFLNLIREFRADAQLVIVSHQRRTMEVADCLYGVTMQPGGSSRVVSERVAARS